MFETLAILTIILIALLVAYLSKIWLAYQFFKRRGIKTPPVQFLFGNWRDIDLKKDEFGQYYEWTKKYGKTYGYYLGHRPVLITSDIKLIEEVFIKQSHNFSARIDRIDFFDDATLVIAEKGKWKRLRNIMNPTFSSAKLKNMTPMINECLNRLAGKINKNSNTDLKVSELLNRFTMDTIWNCAFGIDINPQDDVNNPYFIRSQQVFIIPVDFEFVFFITSMLIPFKFLLHMIFLYTNSAEKKDYLHEFRKILIKAIKKMGDIMAWFDRSKLPPMSWINHHITDVIDLRLKEGSACKEKKDYLQILLDAQIDEKQLNGEYDNITNYNDVYLDKKLTKKETVANLVLFLLAGYETTSNSLSSCLYTLSNHPEEQTKILNEIKDFFTEMPEQPSYDEIQRLAYLDMFVKEVLRFYPIIPLNRRCVKATNACGIEFPEGLSLEVDVFSVHRDMNLWGPVDTNKFYPLRHAPEEKRHPLAFCSFGAGPRNCLGMKFAMLEIKLALYKILTKFEILPTMDKDFKVEFRQIGIRTSKNGVKVICRPRESVKID